MFAFLGLTLPCLAQVTFTAVAGSNWGGNEGADKVCDGNTSTKWCQNGSATESDSYVIIKASQPTYIQGYVMTTANDNAQFAGRTPKEYKLYGSDAQDGTYELIYHQTDDNYIGDKNYTPYTIYCNSTKQYQYYKLHIISSNLSGSTLFQLSEFTLLPATVGMTYNEGHDKAFDGTTGQKWEGNPATSVTLEMSSPTYLKGYQFTTANDNAQYAGRNPMDWIIEGSNDKQTWTRVVSESGNRSMTDVNYTPFYFALSEAPDEAYTYYKITVTRTQGGGYFQLGEVALVGTSVAHTWAENGSVPPTCGNPGYKLLVCSDCGATRSGDAIPATGAHSFDADGVCGECSHPDVNHLQSHDGWYELTSVGDFRWAAAMVQYQAPDLKIRLTDDVDLVGFEGFGNGSDVVPFAGELDGQGHWLKNYSVNTALMNTALFGMTDGAIIHDLGLKDCTVKTSGVNCAVLVGNARNTTINRVAVMGSVSQCRDHVGALVGNAEGSTVISNSLSDAVVTSTQYQAGGLVGTSNGLTLEKCLFVGQVKNEQGRATGLLSLVDSENAPTVIRNNVSSATLIYSKNGELNPIVNTANRKCTFANNHVAQSTVFKSGDNEETKSFTNADDENGLTTPDASMMVKSFYADVMKWDMQQDWKFTAAGHYPVLAWMNAATAQEVNMGTAGYLTMVVSEPLDFTGLDLKACVVRVQGGTALLQPVNQVPAGEAVVLCGQAGIYSVPFAVEQVESLSQNDLKASDGTVQGGEQVYVLANKAHGVGFYPTVDGIAIPQGKGYLLIENASQVHGFVGIGDDDATGVAVVNADDRSTKVYNLAGQRLVNPQRGVNIVNGKKVMY